MRTLLAGMVALACGFGAAKAYALKRCEQFPPNVALELEYVESIDGLPAFGSRTEHHLWLNDAGTQFNSEIELTSAVFDGFDQAATFGQAVEKIELQLSDGRRVVMEIER